MRSHKPPAGILVGSVTDSSGSAVPNASVEAKNLSTNVTSTTKANKNGEYRVDNLLVGRYSLTASAPGFGTSAISDIAVRLNLTATANFTLQVGQVSTTIDVRESAATIDTTTSQISATFDGQDASGLSHKPQPVREC